MRLCTRTAPIGCTRTRRDSGLLCSINAPHTSDGRRRYGVRDAQGALVGTVHRVAPLKARAAPDLAAGAVGEPGDRKQR